MSNVEQQSVNDTTNQKPFIAPCNKLRSFAPLGWLSLGWQDYKKAKLASMSYGLIIVLISYLVFLVSWQYESITLAIAMLSAFIFIAPVLCIGLYSLSRQLRDDQQIMIFKSFGNGFKLYGDLSIFIIVMIIIALLWARAASMIHVFFPMSSESDISEFILFLGIGTVIGSMFSVIIFAVSAFSLPMIMDKKVDMITCCISSINAVLRNKMAMLLWSSILVIFTAIGIITAFIGFLVVIPLLGYATWHGYEEMLIVDKWEDRIADVSQTVETD